MGVRSTLLSGILCCHSAVVNQWVQTLLNSTDEFSEFLSGLFLFDFGVAFQIGPPVNHDTHIKIYRLDEQRPVVLLIAVVGVFLWGHVM